MDLDELARRVSSKTKVVVINSPHNPTGGVLTQERPRVHRRARRTVTTFSFLPTRSIAATSISTPSTFRSRRCPGMRERTIVVDGFSKAYAMTGWRLGYAFMPERLAATVTLFNNNTFSCVATFVQMAGIAALDGPDEPVLRMNEIFRRRRDRLVEGLNSDPGRLVPAARGRVLRVSQRFGNHARRSRAREVLPGGGRRRVRRRLLVRRGGQRLSALLLRGIAGRYRLGARVDRQDDSEVQGVTRATASRALTSARTPAAISRARIVPSAMICSTSAGSFAIERIALAHRPKIGVELLGEIGFVLHAAQGAGAALCGDTVDFERIDEAPEREERTDLGPPGIAAADFLRIGDHRADLLRRRFFVVGR